MLFVSKKFINYSCIGTLYASELCYIIDSRLDCWCCSHFVKEPVNYTFRDNFCISNWEDMHSLDKKYSLNINTRLILNQWQVWQDEKHSG